MLISNRKRKVRFRTNNTRYFSALTGISVSECNLYNLYYVMQTYAVINELHVYFYCISTNVKETFNVSKSYNM